MNPQLQTLKHLHKSLVEKMPSDNILRDKLLDKFNAIIKQSEFIDKLTTEQDPMLSKLAHDMRLTNAKDDLRKLKNEAEKDFQDHLKCERTTLSELRSKKANLTPDEYAPEIRAIFRSLSDVDKTTFLNNALDGKDRTTLAAIFSVPHVLSGLPKEKFDDYSDMALHKMAPYPGNGHLAYAEDISKGVISCAEQIAA